MRKKLNKKQKQLLFKKRNIVFEDSWKMYENNNINSEEAINNFYKSAKEQGFKYAFRSCKPSNFESSSAELYKYNYKKDIFILDPVAKYSSKCSNGINLRFDKAIGEDLVFLYEKKTKRKIGVILYNAGHEPYTIKKSDKIAQMLIRPLYPSSFEIVKDFEDTGRGGYGSSGR